MLCKLPGNFREGDKGTKAISGKPHTEQSWDGGHLEVPSAEMADRGNLSVTPVRLQPPPHACYSQSQGRAQHHQQEQPWDAPGGGKTRAARTVSLRVPSNLDHPALPETNTPTDRHMGTCFHRNLSVLWTTLCKNYSVFLNLDNQNS